MLIVGMDDEIFIINQFSFIKAEYESVLITDYLPSLPIIPSGPD